MKQVYSNTNVSSIYTNVNSNYDNNSNESEIQIIINSPPHTSSNMYETKNNENVHLKKKRKLNLIKLHPYMFQMKLIF